MLARLKSAGFRLGVISNVVSLGQVPHNLRAYGLDHYFEAVVTSSAFGYRKPSPRIFWEATRQMDLPPAACAYVGDTISRDVVGARRAGYGLVHPDQVVSHRKVGQGIRPGDTRRGGAHFG